MRAYPLVAALGLAALATQVADRAKGAAPRPVTFTHNGGPGSSSMWLHMGSIGPVHVETPLVDVAAPAP